MGRKRQKKASEIFQEGGFTFTKPGRSFEEAYPTIEDVTVEVEETGPKIFFGRAKSRKHTYQKNTLGEFIDCSNHDCLAGGFSIGLTLDRMVRENQTHLETSEFCQGCESSPKGRKKYPCEHHFKIKVNIKYKKEE